MLNSSNSLENTHANIQKLQLKSYLDDIFRVFVMHRFSEIIVKKIIILFSFSFEQIGKAEISGSMFFF